MNWKERITAGLTSGDGKLFSTARIERAGDNQYRLIGDGGQAHIGTRADIRDYAQWVGAIPEEGDAFERMQERTAEQQEQTATDGGQVGAPGFVSGGPNDPAEGGTGYVGGFSPFGNDKTGSSPDSGGSGRSLGLLAGVALAGYAVWTVVM